MKNRCIWEGISLMNADSVSQSVLSSFKCNPMMVCLKKMFNGEICHLKQRLKRLSLQVKCPIQIIVKFRTEKICGHFYQLGIIHQSSFERGTKYCHWGTKYCVAVLCNGTNWKFIFPWREIYWHVLQIVKRHFRRFS